MKLAQSLLCVESLAMEPLIAQSSAHRFEIFFLAGRFLHAPGYMRFDG